MYLKTQHVYFQKTSSKEKTIQPLPGYLRDRTKFLANFPLKSVLILCNQSIVTHSPSKESTLPQEIPNGNKSSDTEGHSGHTHTVHKPPSYQCKQ